MGLGRMGNFHRRVLLDFGYKVETVDPDPDREADHAGIPEGSYDVAAVACPPSALAACADRLRGTPMLVEKPFAWSAFEARLLARALAPTPVCIGFVERFNPPVLRLKDELERRMEQGSFPRSVQFTRYSDRPSWDIGRDLLLHDLDLAHYLGVDEVAQYDTRVEQPEMRRRITAFFGERPLFADLLQHDQSPLHGLWHAFLSGREHQTPADAILALSRLEQLYRSAA